MLFGHQDDAAQHSAPQPALSDTTAQSPVPDPTQGVNPLAVDPDSGASLPVVQQGSPAASAPTPAAPVDSTQDSPSVLDQPSAPGYGSPSSFSADPAPTSPFGDDQTVVSPASSAPDSSQVDATLAAAALAPSGAAVAVSDPNLQSSQPPSDYATSDPAAVSVDQSSMPDADGLLSIKQQALSQLGPLVKQLDQSPEERFRTTMMLIQSTDNAALLKDAYEAAQAILDEKTRAQALLDVVNEINYFTQQSQSAPTA